MAKNIILCADGTGNKGGYTPDSNVYKIYNAVEIHESAHRQMRFYDNGVGTATQSYWKALSGAFGFGFGENVCDLYTYLARHYVEGDKIFLFGFSRGAATVRALSGFIAACGLVKGQELDDDDLKCRVAEAFKSYQNAAKHPPQTQASDTSHGVIPIAFIGVWDTVSALGWPQDWKVKGVGVFLFNAFFKSLDALAERIPRTQHRFYNYELTPNVKAAYQALAIDDERRTFQPMVWDERRGGADAEIEQVWFAGVHSNVGGGYERAGLAGVTLDWMMTRASRRGLKFEAQAHQNVIHNADVHGQLYNSRSGLSIYYRYYPRDITGLCQDATGKTKLRSTLRMHRSVLERMQRRTANYAPGYFPHTFNAVDTPIDSPGQPITATANAETWNALSDDVKAWVSRRQILYTILIEFTIFFVLFSGIVWIWEPWPEKAQAVGATALSLDWWTHHLADALDYVLPKYFEGLIDIIVRRYSIIFIVIAALGIGLWRLRMRFQHNTIKACEAIRKEILAAWSGRQAD